MSLQSASLLLNLDFVFIHHAEHTGALLNGNRRPFLRFEFHGTAAVREPLVPGYIIVCTFIAIDSFIEIDPFWKFHCKIVSGAVNPPEADKGLILPRRTSSPPLEALR